MNLWRLAWMVPVLGLTACQEYQVHDSPKAPVAEPPGDIDDDRGDPPNWQDCPKGYLGFYSNLSSDHRDIEPGDDPPDRSDYKKLDWWDEVAFQRFDPSLDFGSGWWPVDEGLAEDPAYYAVRWSAWMRVLNDTDLEFVFGASDDAWFIIDKQDVASLPGIKPYAPELISVPVSSGQFPIQVRFAHRSGDSGLRFRDLPNEDIQICYPDYELDEDE